LNVHLDVPTDLSNIYPDARREEAKARWKPGALMVVPDEYRLIIVDAQDELAMVSLADGEFYRGDEKSEMAVITRWRLIHAIEGNSRELCSIYI